MSDTADALVPAIVLLAIGRFPPATSPGQCRRRYHRIDFPRERGAYMPGRTRSVPGIKNPARNRAGFERNET